MLSDRAEHGLAKLNDTIYVFGCGYGEPTLAEKYIIEHDTWISIREANERFGATACIATVTEIYICGALINYLVKYNPVIDSYTNLPEFPALLTGQKKRMCADHHNIYIFTCAKLFKTDFKGIANESVDFEFDETSCYGNLALVVRHSVYFVVTHIKTYVYEIKVGGLKSFHLFDEISRVN